jgi:hypothetical protein
LSPLPTATHQADVTQDTLAIPLVKFAVLFVFGIVDHVDALTVAGDERVAPAIEPPPPIASGSGSGSMARARVQARAQPKAPKRSSERIGTPLVGFQRR